MSATLYVVGTPIGNLEDMSVRAVRTLQQVDFIAAEDTRVSLKLLNHFEIKNRWLATTSTTPARWDRRLSGGCKTAKAVPS